MSPPVPLTRSVALTSFPLNLAIICWIGPPGAVCTIKKFTTMIASKVGIISRMRRIAYAIIQRRLFRQTARQHRCWAPNPALAGLGPAIHEYVVGRGHFHEDVVG